MHHAMAARNASDRNLDHARINARWRGPFYKAKTSRQLLGEITIRKFTIHSRE